MVSVKEVPKKISAKEKFAAAQAAKLAAKAMEEAGKAKMEAAMAAEKAKHDAVFAKEKKKVAKKIAAEESFESEFRARIAGMNSIERNTLLADLRREVAGFNKDQKTFRMVNNGEGSLIGREAIRFGNVQLMIGILMHA